MFRFIHAADVHLDSPLQNLDQYEGAPADSLRVATREAFDNLIQLAIDEQVNFLLIAGDLYDQDSPDFHTPLHVRKQLESLQRHGIRVFIIQGNHDATRITKKSYDVVTLPDNVHVFSTKKPESVCLDELNVVVHGQGFATRAVEEDLSANYPSAKTGWFNIGLLHTNLGGKESHDNYAPSTVEGLRSKGYQYWALGHIHKRDRGIGGPAQIIHYSGNLQGRHIRETGAKGCTLVTVDDNHQISMKFKATDVWRWYECGVDATGIESPDDVLTEVAANIEKALAKADDRSLAVRVRVTGQTAAHRSFQRLSQHWRSVLQRLALDRFEDRVWLEKVRWETRPSQSPSATEVDSSYGDLISGVQQTLADDEVFADIRDQLDTVLNKIPNDPRFESEAIDLDDELTTASLVAEAKELLVARLMDASDPNAGSDEMGTGFKDGFDDANGGDV